ncbi:MAG TPA: SRPBCC family protein [Vicinamibacteria bacterium]|nr:SRPBCC family protein [Vicinamibacteria bacterium]
MSENRGDQGTIMLIEFSEEFDLPVADVYPYFRTPRDWQRLYGAFGDVGDRGDGWYAVPLRGFPFPLVARVTSDEPLRSVRWEFRGFWRGEGEVRFTPTPGGVAIQGYERITIRHLPWLAPLVERLLLESKFRKVWDSGWRRLRRQAAAGRASAVLAS